MSVGFLSLIHFKRRKPTSGLADRVEHAGRGGRQISAADVWKQFCDWFRVLPPLCSDWLSHRVLMAMTSLPLQTESGKQRKQTLCL